MKWLYFEVKRSKVKVTARWNMVRSTLREAFSPICGMHWLVTTHYQAHVTLITFWRSWVQRSRSRTTFPAEAYWSTVRRLKPSCFCDEFNLNCNVHMHVFSASRLVKRCTVICCLPIVIKCLWFKLICCCFSSLNFVRIGHFVRTSSVGTEPKQLRVQNSSSETMNTLDVEMLNRNYCKIRFFTC